MKICNICKNESENFGGNEWTDSQYLTFEFRIVELDNLCSMDVCPNCLHELGLRPYSVSKIATDRKSSPIAGELTLDRLAELLRLNRRVSLQGDIF